MRGVAIALIVATHCVSIFDWSGHAFAHDVLLDLLDDSTLMFVFIAGFLFQYTGAGFRYGDFLARKFSNVVLPFLLLALPGVVYTLHQVPTLQALGIAAWPRSAQALYLYVYPGSQVDYPLWFMPVVALYFVAAPLLRVVVRHPRAYAVILLLVPLSLWMQRPKYSHGHNLELALYFLPAYLTGMLGSQYIDRIGPWLDRRWQAVIGAALLVFLAHLWLAPHHGKYVAGEGAAGDLDWLFVQKLLLCFALWACSRRVRTMQLTWLDRLADASFTIFFLHVYVIFAIQAWAFHFQRPAVQLLPLLAVFLAALGAPWLVAHATKTMWPRWSRMLVGA